MMYTKVKAIAKKVLPVMMVPVLLFGNYATITSYADEIDIFAENNSTTEKTENDKAASGVGLEGEGSSGEITGGENANGSNDIDDGIQPGQEGENTGNNKPVVSTDDGNNTGSENANGTNGIDDGSQSGQNDALLRNNGIKTQNNILGGNDTLSRADQLGLLRENGRPNNVDNTPDDRIDNTGDTPKNLTESSKETRIVIRFNIKNSEKNLSIYANGERIGDSFSFKVEEDVKPEEENDDPAEDNDDSEEESYDPKEVVFTYSLKDNHELVDVAGGDLNADEKTITCSYDDVDYDEDENVYTVSGEVKKIDDEGPSIESPAVDASEGASEYEGSDGKGVIASDDISKLGFIVNVTDDK